MCIPILDYSMKAKTISNAITNCTTALCLATASFTTHANGESLLLDGGEQALLSTITAFSIKHIDQVTDDCLPTPSALIDTMSAALKKEGFRIVDRPGSRAQAIVISTMGYQTSAAPVCALSFKVFIELPIIATVPHASHNPSGDSTLIVHSYELRHELLTGSKSDMQARLETATEAAAHTAFVDISRAKERIFASFPAIKQELDAQAM